MVLKMSSRRFIKLLVADPTGELLNVVNRLEEPPGDRAKPSIFISTGSNERHNVQPFPGSRTPDKSFAQLACRIGTFHMLCSSLNCAVGGYWARGRPNPA